MHIIKIPYINGKELFYWKNESSGKLQTTISKLLEAKDNNALSEDERLWLRR